MLFVGLHLNVLIDESLVTILRYTAVIISITLYYIALKNRERLKETYKKAQRKFSPWFVVISLFIAIPVISELVIAKALPSLLHYIVTSPSSLVVTVNAKGRAFDSSKYCHGKVEVKEYQYNFSINKICLNDKALWSSLKSGDKLTLTGDKSFIGFSYSEFKKS